MRCLKKLVSLTIVCTLGLVLQAQEAAVNSFWPGLLKPERTDVTSLKIIDLHLKSRGGKEAMESVGSIKLTGKLFEGQKEYHFEGTYTQGGQARFEITFDVRGYEHRTVKASDGTLVWQRKLLPEKQSPTGISGKERALFDFEARLPFLLLHQKSAGQLFAYVGKEKYLGRNAYVLHGWLETGFQLDILFDENSFQILNYRHPYEIGGKVLLVNLTPSKLKREEGVWWEMEYKMNHQGKTFRTVSFDKIKTHVDTDGVPFKLPDIKQIWLRGSRN